MRDRSSPLGAADIGALAWEKMDGLLPAAVQDAATGQLLMLAYMSREALAATFERGVAVFHSRSRESLWEKGATSGNHMVVREIRPDCDGDALLVRVEPAGPACHLGTPSCFGTAGAQGVGFLGELSRIVAGRAGADPDDSYTARLLADGPAKVAQKIGEEGVELALAAVSRDRDGCIEEASDLLYHLTVLMSARGFDWDDIAAVLRRRHES